MSHYIQSKKNKKKTKKDGEYWKLAHLEYKLKLPITFKSKGDQIFHLKNCNVNYFSNGIGVAEMIFAWSQNDLLKNENKQQESSDHNNDAKQQQIDEEEEGKKENCSVQSLLDIQRFFLDDEICKIVKTKHEKTIPESSSKSDQDDKQTKKKTKSESAKISVSTTLTELFVATISRNVDEHPYILTWSPIDHISPFFVYSQILVEANKNNNTPTTNNEESTTNNEQGQPKVNHNQNPKESSHIVTNNEKPQSNNEKSEHPNGESSSAPEELSQADSSPWNQKQLAYLTYLFTSCATNDKIEVKDDFLDTFLKKNCYLRWAHETGGLWVGFTAHGAAAIHFSNSAEDIEKLKERKSSHNPELMSQLIKPLLFQRAYLQVEINHVRHLINQTAKAKTLYSHGQISSALKMIEGNLIRFNLIFCDEITGSTAAKAIFEIWQNKLSIDTLKKNLATHVQDLSNFYEVRIENLHFTLQLIYFSHH